MSELTVSLVLMQASALLAVIGYIYNDTKKRDKRRKEDIEGVSKQIQQINNRVDKLESNLYGHEKGSKGYITMTQEQIDEIHSKLDSIQTSMEEEHIEVSTLLGEIVQWIEEQEDGEIDLDYDRSLRFKEDD